MTRSISLAETEFAGAMKIRFYDVDVSAYDATNGESFTPADVGMSRFQQVVVTDAGGSGVDPQFDRANEVIRLYDQNGELAADSTASLRVMAIGR